ncbi:MAG TPA: hypothetical protein V6C81_11345 [Planktothrix sp.]|jgi:hypothetical protein
MTNQLENTDVASLPSATKDRSTYQSISKNEWQSFSAGSTAAADAAPNDELVAPSAYGNQSASAATDATSTSSPNQQAGPLDSVTKSLQSDAAALKTETKGSASYDKTVDQLNSDESTLHSDVQNFLQSSAKDSNYVTFSNALEGYHSALKSVATDLWDMGLKNQASETTAEYPLSHYQKYFKQSGSGSGGDGGGGTGSGGGSTGGDGGGTGSGGSASGDNPAPPSGSTEVNNLLSDTQKANINKGEIGGSGNIDSMTATPTGSNSDEITMKAAAGSGDWGDGLLLNSIHNSTTDQNVGQTLQLNKTFSFTQSQLDNLNEYENDINNATGMHGTQINVKTGAVDAWDAANSKWMQVGSFGGPLKAGVDYNLQIDTHDNADGSITYDGYYLNGKNTMESPVTVGGKPLHWAAGDYIQTQLDFDGSTPGGSETGVTESNESLYVKND